VSACTGVKSARHASAITANSLRMFPSPEDYHL
jgi:hypothetical protein